MGLAENATDNARFRALIEHAADGIALMRITENRGYMTYLSPSTQKILGYEPRSLINRDPAEWTHPDDLPEIHNKLLPLIATPSAKLVMQYRMRHANGHYVWLETHFINLLDDPLVHALVLNFRDITERKERDEQIEKALLAAELANSTKGHFLSSMSHELRTPLNAIIGFASLLKMDTQNAVHRERAGLVLMNARHLLTLIDAIRDYSLLDSGQFKFEIHPVDIPHLLRTVTDPFRFMLEKQQLHLRMRVPDRLRLMTDGQIISQILNHLVSNAIKYNKTGGAVGVRCFRRGTYWRITITDTGSGISREQQSRIFEPFERLGFERSKVQGTGLGLTIVRQLTQEMKYPFGFWTRSGLGSVFWIEIPIAESEVRAEEASQDLADEKTPDAAELRGKILYFEDNEINAELLCAVFRKFSPFVQVDVAPDAESGLQKVRSEKPDLIIMDVHLPGMNGFEATMQIHSTPETSQIPVIGLSADASERARQAAAQATMDDYVTKPFEAMAFLQLCASYLQKNSA